MTRFTQKYAIIQLFEDMSVGTQFAANNWPLHSTIADTFAIDWDVPTMAEKLTELLKNHAQANSVVEDDRFFGDDGLVQVALLKKTDDLNSITMSLNYLSKPGGGQTTHSLQRLVSCLTQPCKNRPDSTREPKLLLTL